MKTASLLFALGLAAASLAADMNPVMWADVPDISICRKGDTFYMTSTTMHFNPGIPVMVSKDLVNWRIASYCYSTIENRPKDNLENGENDYLFGTWASSIRYNESDGYFYVSSFNNKVDSTYLFRTRTPETGPWEFFRIPERCYDHSLWIENGRFMFLATDRGRVRLRHLKNDFSGFEDAGRIVLDSITDCVPTKKGLGEGCQLFKKDGFYYLFNICWPAGHCRLVAVHRAKSLEGPWEGRTVYECEGIAQGGMVDTPSGKWYAYLFGDRGGVGRIPYMIPIEWEDGWPVFPKDAAGHFTRPPLEIPGVVKDPIPGCVASDEFDSPALANVWQFNHNPDPANWSLSARPGYFRITTSRTDANLLTAKNTLAQRTFGPVSAAVAKLDYSGLNEGDTAGLALFQACYGFIGIEKTASGANIVLWQNGLDAKDRHAARPVGKPSKILSIPAPKSGDDAIYLRAVCDFRPWPNPNYLKIPASEDACRFYWSADGKAWHALGEAMFLPYTIAHFTGYRFALFAYSAKTPGGHADFDFFRVSADVPEDELLMSNGSNPVIKTTFTPDPAGYADGETFYLFTGHDEPDARGYKMRNWQIFKSTDMHHWESLGRVLDCARVFPWAKGDGAWASHAIKRSGKWYWYCAVFRKGGKSGIAVATADKLEGPWRDAIGGPLVEGSGYIDPAAFVDDDGQAWLFWGNCGGNPGLWYAPLKDNMYELAGPVKPVPGLMDAAAFGAPLKKKRGAGAYKPIDTNFEEAPWIYKHDGRYYLEYAAGGVPEYWAYSWAESIHGPWHWGGKIMDNAGGTGTIHGGSVLFKGQWYMVYHNGLLPGGGDCRRSACIIPYERNSDGSIPFLIP